MNDFYYQFQDYSMLRKEKLFWQVPWQHLRIETFWKRKWLKRKNQEWL